MRRRWWIEPAGRGFIQVVCVHPSGRVLGHTRVPESYEANRRLLALCIRDCRKAYMLALSNS